MQVVYAKEAFPKSSTKSIFLAGPTPRSKDVSSWRPSALEFLTKSGYDGQVYVPEPRDGNWSRGGYNDQVEWEEEGLNRADVILFWIPRSDQLPGLTTNDEWGFWKNTGKVVLGVPEGNEKSKYQAYYATKYGAPVCKTLESTLEACMKMVGKGALRSEGEVYVPYYIWRTASFQNWYKNLKDAGNVLKKATVHYSLRKPKKDKDGKPTLEMFVFLWVLKVEVWITKENRLKSNEVVVSRLDQSATVLYKKRETLGDCQVVLVKEYRAPVNNKENYVYELPSGSIATDDQVDSLNVAVEEVEEETGFKAAKNRFRDHNARQVVAAFSTHKSHLFSVELSEEEMQKMVKEIGKIHGVETDTERTYIDVQTVNQILSGNLVDWAVTGMILSVLAPLFQEESKRKVNQR